MTMTIIRMSATILEAILVTARVAKGILIISREL